LLSGRSAEYLASMRRSAFAGLILAAAGMAVLVAPVLAHGDHDARPLARGLRAGPHVISLWQVYPDAGTSMTPHLIVLFDGVGTAPPEAEVGVVVNGAPMGVHRSTTTSNGWETMAGVSTWDMVAVTVSEGGQAWRVDPVIVGPPPTSMLPMRELVAFAIVLTAGSALWAARSTARAWRRTEVIAS
jgi:hypothetical protein